MKLGTISYSLNFLLILILTFKSIFKEPPKVIIKVKYIKLTPQPRQKLNKSKYLRKIQQPTYTA